MARCRILHEPVQYAQEAFYAHDWRIFKVVACVCANATVLRQNWITPPGADNGYRYYDSVQLRTLLDIERLKGYGFILAEKCMDGVIAEKAEGKQ